MKPFISVVILLAGLATATVLSASTISDSGSIQPCGSNTLAFYENIKAGGAVTQCSVGILLFSNFTFAKSGTGASETDTDIILNPFSDATDIGGGFNLALANPNSVSPAPAFTVAAGQSATYTIDWNFVIDPGPVGSGADLGMDPPFGDVSITQNYCLDSQFTFSDAGVSCTNGQRPDSLFVNVANPTDHLNFHPPAQNFGNVMTTIQLNGNSQTGSSGFDSATTSSSVTPEPVTMVLAFAGLVGIATARRKFKPQS